MTENSQVCVVIPRPQNWLLHSCRGHSNAPILLHRCVGCHTPWLVSLWCPALPWGLRTPHCLCSTGSIHPIRCWCVPFCNVINPRCGCGCCCLWENKNNKIFRQIPSAFPHGPTLYQGYGKSTDKLGPAAVPKCPLPGGLTYNGE